MDLPRVKDNLAGDVIMGDKLNGIANSKGKEGGHSHKEESEELHSCKGDGA